MVYESVSLCVCVCVCVSERGCLYNKFDSDEIHNLLQKYVHLCNNVLILCFSPLLSYLDYRPQSSRTARSQEDNLTVAKMSPLLTLNIAR